MSGCDTVFARMGLKFLAKGAKDDALLAEFVVQCPTKVRLKWEGHQRTLYLTLYKWWLMVDNGG